MFDPYVHLIAGLCIVSRIGDVATTYLGTPTLKLESNSIARRLGWRYAFLTIAAGFIPYYSPPLGVIVLTASFLVAASNASKLLLARAIGEEEFARLTRKACVSTAPWPALALLALPAVFMIFLGGTMLLFYSSSTEWGYYFALGFLTYAFAILVWGLVRYFRFRRSDSKT
jgi:hypothetical protein